MNFTRQLQEQFVIPVLRQADEAALVGTSRALAAGGMKVLEVTLMSDAAFGAISTLSKDNTLLVGAGTVLTRAQAERAVKAGAGFLVSPGLCLEVLDFARSQSVPYVPGVLTPSEITLAQARGATLLKVFPASAVGGAAYLRQLKGPFPSLQWMATGGVGIADIPAYVAAGALCVGIGGQLAPDSVVARGDWAKVTQIAAEHLAAVAAARSKNDSPS
jgi:2-dehydro-3-deoxyphosphogluconate aldolase/(4S)-4-hydroxy-2-oxoglutarate aldolase